MLPAVFLDLHNYPRLEMCQFASLSKCEVSLIGRAKDKLGVNHISRSHVQSDDGWLPHTRPSVVYLSVRPLFMILWFSLKSNKWHYLKMS